MIDFSNIRTIPIEERENKVTVADFRSPGDNFRRIDDPGIDRLADMIAAARIRKRPVVFMCGAHLIKVGMSLYIIDLIRKRVITHFATNGAGSIHDFEVALIGETSEDVKTNLEDGSFGMAEETGRMMNQAIISGAEAGIGYGQAICDAVEELPYKDKSIFYACRESSTRATVHVAIGTDIIHQHPSCSGEALGKTSYHDFRLLADTLSEIEGGVVVNVGSAVIMPEVFLKALTIVRNLGYESKGFTAANLDMKDMYRPRVNVVQRPTKDGITVIGRHEDTIPSLYDSIMKRLSDPK